MRKAKTNVHARIRGDLAPYQSLRAKKRLQTPHTNTTRFKPRPPSIHLLKNMFVRKQLYGMLQKGAVEL